MIIVGGSVCVSVGVSVCTAVAAVGGIVFIGGGGPIMDSGIGGIVRVITVRHHSIGIVGMMLIENREVMRLMMTHVRVLIHVSGWHGMMVRHLHSCPCVSVIGVTGIGCGGCGGRS